MFLGNDSMIFTWFGQQESWNTRKKCRLQAQSLWVVWGCCFLAWCWVGTKKLDKTGGTRCGWSTSPLLMLGFPVSGFRFPAMTAFNVSVLRLLTNCYPVSRPPKIDSRFAENRTDDTTADFVLRVLYGTYLTLLVQLHLITEAYVYKYYRDYTTIIPAMNNVKC